MARSRLRHGHDPNSLARPVSTESEYSPVCLLLAFHRLCVIDLEVFFTYSRYVHLLTYFTHFSHSSLHQLGSDWRVPTKGVELAILMSMYF